MKFGIFYEHQLPRPWDEGSEYRLIQDALEEIELADALGIDCVWEVEHHFLEEYSHSSAPEIFLAAASQRTKNIRLGHGIVLMPPGYNAPARIAERIATLDLVSNGRAEFGTGESASRAELEGFGIRLNKKPPAVTVRKKDKGGIAITNTVPLTNIDHDEIKAVLSEYRINNADVAIRQAGATADDLVDVIEGNRYVLSSLARLKAWYGAYSTHGRPIRTSARSSDARTEYTSPRSTC